MAVDTVGKRQSAFNFCDPFDHIMPAPDGVVGASDRQHLWGLYSGILSAAPPAVLDAGRVSAFNFCDPFDHILPPADGVVGALDRQHLWGMYTGIAADTPTEPPIVEEARASGGWLSREQVDSLRRMQREAERAQERGKRGRKRVAQERLQELEGIFNRIHGIIPPEAAESVAEIVRPFSASSDQLLPPPFAVDFTSLLQDMRAVQQLAAALIEATNDEEEVLMLLMMT